MRKIRQFWLSREEVENILGGNYRPVTNINAGYVGGLTAGSIPFANATGFLAEDNANLFWDAANIRLGVDQAVPTAKIDIIAAGAEPGINISAAANGEMSTPDGEQFRWGHWNAGTTTFTERLKFDAAGLFYISYLTAASVIFADAGGEIKQDNANFYWDNINKRLGIGKTPSNVLDVEGVGTVTGGTSYGGVIAVFHCTENKHVTLAINAKSGYDPVLSLSENNSSVWDIRNDASATDEFQIRYQVAEVNATYLAIDNAGNFDFQSGNLVTLGTLGCGTITVANGASINLQEDITFTGATGVNLIKFPDNLPDALSFMEGANPYQTFITTNGSEAIQFHEDVLLKASTEYGAGNKTTGAWTKSIGGAGDYADWLTMIADMPDLIAHAVTVTIKAGTTLSEICNIKNKHGVTPAGLITIQAEKYFPTTGVILTADSATATTLRDATLAVAALGDDYFNGCWILINDGTGTDNGYVLITDYIDATGDVVVAAWPGTQPDNTSRYQIYGALIDGGGTRSKCFDIKNTTCEIRLYGIGMQSATKHNLDFLYSSYLTMWYCGTYNAQWGGLQVGKAFASDIRYCGIVGNNTDNSVSYGGLICGSGNHYTYKNGISDNNQRGIYIAANTFTVCSNNFGDGNGIWGIYCQYSGQALIVGTECSGSGGNHNDPGTAGDNSADQAAAY